MGYKKLLGGFLVVVWFSSFRYSVCLNNQSVYQINNLNYIKAALLAGAAGDAMGRVTEFLTVNQIFVKYPKGISSFDDMRADFIN